MVLPPKKGSRLKKAAIPVEEGCGEAELGSPKPKPPGEPADRPADRPLCVVELIYIGVVVGIVILLLLYRLMVVGKILIFENLGVGTLPIPPNESPDRDELSGIVQTSF